MALAGIDGTHISGMGKRRVYAPAPEGTDAGRIIVAFQGHLSGAALYPNAFCSFKVFREKNVQTSD